MQKQKTQSPFRRCAGLLRALGSMKTLLAVLFALAIYLGFPSLCAAAIAPQDSQQMPDAPVENEEGGAIRITGQLTYTFSNFARGIDQPSIVMIDNAGFVDRNRHFVAPIESQVLGQFLSDFRQSPFTYTLALPIEPIGELRDVDGDEQEDEGVMIFAIYFSINLFGDSYLDTLDQGAYGWPRQYVSTRVTRQGEITGGKLIVYALDDQQGFPAEFGDDGLLFTGDEPTVRLPQGYTVVDLDANPFRFDRSRYPEVAITEPNFFETVDLSELSYTEAFDQLIDTLRERYAFTEAKNVDWDALHATFRPQIEQAEQDQDSLAFRRALGALAMSIPDGHMNGSIVEDITARTEAGVGMSLCKTDDGRILISSILPDSSADLAGIEEGAELIAINGVPAAQYISEIEPIWNGSTVHARELQQLHLAPLAPDGTEVEVTFSNPGTTDDYQTVELVSVDEDVLYVCVTRSQLIHGYFSYYTLDDYFTSDDRYRWVTSTNFGDESRLTVMLWERIIASLNEGVGEGLIIDLRNHAGGRFYLGAQMLAYLLNEPFNTFTFGKSNSAEVFQPDSPAIDRIVPVAAEERYNGPVAVLIGPYCMSACEMFAYVVKESGRGAVIGAYPTAGMVSSINEVYMPEGESFGYSEGSVLDANGQIALEGTGVVPSILVPINEETIFSETDPVMEAAVDYFESLSEE